MSTPDFFRSRLDQMIDLRHPLVVLSTRLRWASIEAAVAPNLAHEARPAKRVAGIDLAGAFDGEFDGGISPAGRPRLPIRLMVSLLYLKNSFNLSDEELVERWAENVQWQFFSGMDYYEPRHPLLANVLLDEVDRELERRGHRFVRYADDCNVYVKSRKAGERVLKALRGCYAKLVLKVNESKTAVAEVWGRKFLGYCFWAHKDETKRAVAGQTLKRLRQRLRELTRRTSGRSLAQIAERLRADVPGWKAYFRLAQTPTVMRRLDAWLRHRLRAVQLKQWRSGPTIFRELCKLGASKQLAARVASHPRSWWHNSRLGLTRILTIALFDRAQRRVAIPQPQCLDQLLACRHADLPHHVALHPPDHSTGSKLREATGQHG